MGLAGGELKELEYEIKDSNLIFITDNLSDFYIAAEVHNTTLLRDLGIGAGVLIFLAAGLVFLIIAFKRRKKAAYKVAEVNVLQKKDETVVQRYADTNKNELKVCELKEKEFVIDGIRCRSYQSFLASLNYKDVFRQKEICSYATEKANRCAAGKGNGKRKELYWQGKKIKRDSKEYYELIEKATRINNLN